MKKRISLMLILSIIVSMFSIGSFASSKSVSHIVRDDAKARVVEMPLSNGGYTVVTYDKVKNILIYEDYPNKKDMLSRIELKNSGKATPPLIIDLNKNESNKRTSRGTKTVQFLKHDYIKYSSSSKLIYSIGSDGEYFVTHNIYDDSNLKSDVKTWTYYVDNGKKAVDRTYGVITDKLEGAGAPSSDFDVIYDLILNLADIVKNKNDFGDKIVAGVEAYFGILVSPGLFVGYLGVVIANDVNCKNYYPILEAKF